MAEAGGLPIDGAAQVEGADNGFGSEVEVFIYQLEQALVINLGGAEGFHRDGEGVGDADGVGNLDFEPLG